MNFFGLSFPMGRFFGISVRIHILFILYILANLNAFGPPAVSLLVFTGLYLSVLLHEFGHAFAARFCDGKANLIILWPLGGLAFCRPLFNPTAHLITAAAGPFVTLLLYLLFHCFNSSVLFGSAPSLVAELSRGMEYLNRGLLLFNLIPAFPMDGGRIVRDTLWHWLRVEKATNIAVQISKALSTLGILRGILTHEYQLAILALFIFFASSAERRAMAFEGPVQPFSLLERIKRGNRPRPYPEIMEN